jgi:HAD superfamily hydrolase (TIGR01549 family)
MPEDRAVLLDLWHTLLYLEPADEERYMAELIETEARLFGSWPRSPRARHPRLRDPRRAAEAVRTEAVMAARRGVSMPMPLQAEHAARSLGRVARPLELTRASAAIVERARFRVCPGAAETLAELQGRGIRLGVVSNTVGEPGEALQRWLERAGVGRYIEAWAFSDQLPWAKPAPEIFWHCLGMLSRTRQRAVHVGDGGSDIAGARAAGLRAGILYTGNRDYGESYRRLFAPDPADDHGAEYRIERLDKLPTLVDRLLPE